MTAISIFLTFWVVCNNLTLLSVFVAYLRSDIYIICFLFVGRHGNEGRRDFLAKNLIYLIESQKVGGSVTNKYGHPNGLAYDMKTFDGTYFPDNPLTGPFRSLGGAWYTCSRRYPHKKRSIGVSALGLGSVVAIHEDDPNIHVIEQYVNRSLCVDEQALHPGATRLCVPFHWPTIYLVRVTAWWTHAMSKIDHYLKNLTTALHFPILTRIFIQYPFWCHADLGNQSYIH